MTQAEIMGGTTVPVVGVEELERDPHGVFAQYRPTFPFILRNDGVPLVLRAADVQRLITDPRTRQGETEFAQLMGITEGPIFDIFRNGVLTSNGNDHRRRRAPFATTFSFRLVREMRPHIRRIAEGLIDEAHPRGEMEFVSEFAALVPARAISAILGLPAEDIPRFTALVYTVSRFLSLTFTREELPAIVQAAAELLDYVAKTLEARRANPQDDFLTAYLASVDETGELSPIETLVQIAILVIAGSDTTRGALAMQTALLLQHREQWDAVRRDPELIPGAVAEALRFEPSVGSVGRVTLEPIELDGHLLPGGRFVTLSTLSAMRDPDLYRDPDVFDIRRADHPKWHMVFGGGPHRCLGEALARTELEESLAALTARLPEMTLVGELPQLRGHFGIRRIGAMRVAWPVASA